MNIASFVLELVNRAPTNGREAESVVAAKQWLGQIQRGELVVGKPVAEPASEKPQ
jgi:hypothetical protein